MIDNEEYNMNNVPDDDTYDDEVLDNDDDNIYIEDENSDIDITDDIVDTDYI